MKNTFLLLLIWLSVSPALAQEMSCLVGVYKASDLKTIQDVIPKHVFGTITVSVDENAADAGQGQTMINSEKVEVVISKFEYTDIYDLSVLLKTPEADRPASFSFVTTTGGKLANAGPAGEGQSSLPIRVGSVLYQPLENQNGNLTITPKLEKAMVAQGLWGQGMKRRMATDRISELYAPVQKLLAVQAISTNDVVAIATVGPCIRNP